MSKAASIILRTRNISLDVSILILVREFCRVTEEHFMLVSEPRFSNYFFIVMFLLPSESCINAYAFLLHLFALPSFTTEYAFQEKKSLCCYCRTNSGNERCAHRNHRF